MLKYPLFFILILILFLIGSLPVFSQVLGDVNIDDIVNIVDALILSQYYVGLDPPVFNPDYADVNCNNNIDIIDSLLIAQYYVGLITDFPCSITPVPTPTIDTTVEPTQIPTLPPWGLKVQYRCGEVAVETNQIRPVVNIINTGETSVSLSELSLHYYFTKEGSADQEFHVDHSIIGNEHITGSFLSGYLEVTFLSSAGSLNPGNETGEMQLRINKTDWSVFDQSDDWSFNPVKTSFTDWENITLYQSGVFVWGIEPGGNTPGPTPEPTPTPVPTLTPQPRTYYVDSISGSDLNDGLSPETPWARCPDMPGFSGSAELHAGDTVYFNNTRTWEVSTGNAAIEVTGGVIYDGSSWGSGNRAILRAAADLPKTVVNFMKDHPDIPTIVRGFEIDANKYVTSGVGLNWPWVQMDLLGAVKRIEDCIIHDTWSLQTQGQYEYGIILSGWSNHHIKNVEILNCKVYNTSRDGICNYLGNDIPENSSEKVLIRGCEVYNTGQDPDYTSGAGIAAKNYALNCIIEYNYVHDTNGAGIGVSSHPEAGFIGPEGLTIRYNIIRDCGHAGIYIAHNVLSVDIYGNLIHNNPYANLYITGALQEVFRVRVFNNTFYQAHLLNPFGWAPEVIIEENSVNFSLFEFKNNILYSVPGTPCLLDDGQDITDHSNNLYFGTQTDKIVRANGTTYGLEAITEYEPTAQNSEPLFKNPAGFPYGFTGNYGIDLRPESDGMSLLTGSPALDAGVSLSSEYSGSINGETRPAGTDWDIGAYEQ